MNTQEKRETVRYLLKLMHFRDMFLMKDVPEQMQKLYDDILDKQLEIMVELYDEFFSEELLQSQIEFYESDQGKKVINAQMIIWKQYPSRLRKLITELDNQSPFFKNFSS